jgi:hypothetical protein
VSRNRTLKILTGPRESGTNRRTKKLYNEEILHRWAGRAYSCLRGDAKCSANKAEATRPFSGIDADGRTILELILKK